MSQVFFTNIIPSNDVVPTAVSRTPLRRIQLQRDNCEARLSRTGRPGSKRYQRFLNKQELLSADSIEIDPVWTAGPRLFAELLRTPTQCAVYAASADDDTHTSSAGGPSRQQRHASSARDRQQPLDNITPHSLRRLLIKHRESDSVRQLDARIASFLQAPSQQRLQLHELTNEPFLRLLCHGICAFYGCSSHSETLAGVRVFFVKKAKTHAAPAHSVPLRQALALASC
eukprot:TRINITY_DN5041_c0_g1_i1.p1 TRINITY_DN5041_c0_g1~~TRINITY_DN5041_c0_g1_i1.p1  ORF type:complete len:250 (-),score=39.34 TRINITY_DN5041_c0_g1_i1:89-772(-)